MCSPPERSEERRKNGVRTGLRLRTYPTPYPLLDMLDTLNQFRHSFEIRNVGQADVVIACIFFKLSFCFVDFFMVAC